MPQGAGGPTEDDGSRTATQAPLPSDARAAVSSRPPHGTGRRDRTERLTLEGKPVVSRAMNVAPFSDLGKEANDVLRGGSKGGSYQYDQKVKVSTKAKDGMGFTLSSTMKGDKLLSEFKMAYNFQRYSFEGTADNSSKVTAKSTITDFMTRGLKCTASAALPVTSPAKVGVQYVRPYLNTKLDVELAATPKVDLALTTGYANGTIGGSCTYDSTKGSFSSWNIGAGYKGPGYQSALLFSDKGNMKLLHSHCLTETSLLGVEIVRPLKEDTGTTFSFGYSKALESGALAKVKVDNAGLVSMLWEQHLDRNVRMGLSGQLDVKAIDKAAKVGVAFDMN